MEKTLEKLHFKERINVSYDLSIMEEILCSFIFFKLQQLFLSDPIIATFGPSHRLLDWVSYHFDWKNKKLD